MRPVLVFDSGLGGISVLRAIRAALPSAPIVYAADTAGFPYGQCEPEALTLRVVSVVGELVAAHDPAAVVIACNTASTLVLPPLRARHDIPFVGTVPAIKPAAAATRSGLVSVLATPGTVARDYTRGLIRDFASGAKVTLVGAPRLASMAEASMAGEPADPAALAAEIGPAFVADGVDRTDTIVLACTHFPLILPALRSAAPWPVAWIDPAAAIARRLVEVAGAAFPARGAGQAPGLALFSSPAAGDALQQLLSAEGLEPAGTFGSGI